MNLASTSADKEMFGTVSGYGTEFATNRSYVRGHVFLLLFYTLIRFV